MSDEIHVWRVALSVPKPLASRLRFIISPDERERADRLYFARDRTHFVIARAALRSILAGYLDARPAELAFSYGPQGKPALQPGSNSIDLCFNLSHSGGLALVAVAQAREVGVDVERFRPVADALEIAQRFFSPVEFAELCTLPEVVRLHAFFACWTRKEAYLKARSEGLSLPLDQFDVSLAPGQPVALLRTGNPAEATRWSLYGLDPGPGYFGALATEGRECRLICWHWREL